MRLVLFCEASADFRTTSGLVDRVLREKGGSWVADVIDAHPEAVREWVSDGHGKPFFDIHRLTAYTRQLGNVRVPQGHFDGKPGAPGALMARTALHLVRELLRRAPESVDAVLVVWDMDDQGDARRAGLAQARGEASRWAPFRIVLGCPDPEREAWVLAGFAPEDATEHARLEAEHAALGFSPCEEPHRVRDKSNQGTRSPKRVPTALTSGDARREERCWTDAPLERLRARGGENGLRAFLDEAADLAELPAAHR